MKLARSLSFLSIVLCLAGIAAAQELSPISLPKPRTEGGKPLMETLKNRKSSREFSNEKLSPQTLSNLLWAAWGLNRSDGRRTAPSASNRQEVDVYAATADGLYRYDAAQHRLIPVAAGDVRALTGTQDFVKEAPLNLIYVADFAKVGPANEDRLINSGADVGFIGQNVYLFCASEGLATVVRGSVPRGELAKAMKLRPEQRIILAQSVGYPKK